MGPLDLSGMLTGTLGVSTEYKPDVGLVSIDQAFSLNINSCLPSVTYLALRHGVRLAVAATPQRAGRIVAQVGGEPVGLLTRLLHLVLDLGAAG